MLAAALIIAGVAVMFLGLRHMLNRLREDLRREFQDQIDSLYVKIRLREPVAAAWPDAAPILGPMPGSKTARDAASPAPQGDAAQSSDCPEIGDQIAPETLAIITETVSAFLGKKVQVRSARLLETATPEAARSQPVTATWSQQGRAMVQVSHDLVQARMPPTSVRHLSGSLRGVAFEASDRD
jgi:hypothetical protein